MLSKGIEQEVGISVPAGDIKSLGTSLIGEAEKALHNPNLMHEAEHEVEGMIRDVSGLEVPSVLQERV